MTAQDTPHLAIFNVARLKKPLADPVNADFVANTDRINGIAERSPGFVWRLSGQTSDGTLDVLSDDGLLVPQYSIWESREQVRFFIWKTLHRVFMNRTAEWFQPHEAPPKVLWHVTPGDIPPVADAAERLRSLQQNGPGDGLYDLRYLTEDVAPASSYCAAPSAGEPDP